MLRISLDTEEQTIPGTSVAKLFGQPEQAPPKPVTAARPKVVAAPKVVTVQPVSEPPIEIFAGSKKTVTQNGEGR